MFTLLLLLAYGHAADPSYSNLAHGDFDNDGKDDLAIGIDTKCGTVDVWLTSDSITWPRPSTSRVSLPTPSFTLKSDKCDPDFGSALGVKKGEKGDVLMIGGGEKLIWSWSWSKDPGSTHASEPPLTEETYCLKPSGPFGAFTTCLPIAAECDDCCGGDSCCIGGSCQP